LAQNKFFIASSMLRKPLKFVAAFFMHQRVTKSKHPPKCEECTDMTVKSR
jgi:hypothetical protein